MRADPSPVVELNRAAAVAMRDGSECGLKLIDDLLARGELAEYPWCIRRERSCAGSWGERRKRDTPMNERSA
jgi:predicted RNA polymerase sigma factor